MISLARWCDPQLWPLHPHLVFETLAYAVGALVFHCLRQGSTDPLEEDHRWSVVVAAALGAALGARILGLLVDPASLLANLSSPIRFMAAGKTVVGGLLGGLIAVETCKHLLGIRQRSGDLFALPLCAGIATGRLGCFFSGLADRTHGLPSSLPWAVELGDGIGRHPVQLYEILALAGIALWVRAGTPPQGGRFRRFMLGYLAFRLLVDPLKPLPRWLGLSTIQLACLVGLTHYLWRARSRFGAPESRDQPSGISARSGASRSASSPSR